ncbi:hypothetical protein SARC_12770 [Sphaeroforma arctica JP610]|uniref:Uncharacterized protein n=1 Tax=Sphaeroforma arctica JP610 TaxID=667725 RepID=A0A0L0FD72_9EUKA|nr:hypothetical protein SARC_12770 [Sphaeroforma arctica JP610]KNC74690.1 hypothetical protein SARC_12770 [Sphaeroforma arctica JP610]|eukprot:XP_014148592.1 hypothetical protein SARC_12770 [Sphaeroforma arctica JP610]
MQGFYVSEFVAIVCSTFANNGLRPLWPFDTRLSLGDDFGNRIIEDSDSIGQRELGAGSRGKGLNTLSQLLGAMCQSTSLKNDHTAEEVTAVWVGGGAV